MGWAEYKQAARDIVHKTMGYEAVYNDASQVDVPCTVRLHRKSAFIGDDIADFSPGLFSQINRIIVDSGEVTPTRGASIYVVAANKTFYVESFIQQGENKILCEVRE